MASAAFVTFITSVDDTPPAFADAVASALHDGGFPSTQSLDKAVPAEVFEVFPAEGERMLTAPKKAFVRRVIEKASAGEQTALAVLPPPPSLFAPPSSPAQLNELFGAGASAEMVASALSTKAPPVDVHDLLSKSAVGALPPMMVLETSVWQAMLADCEQARKLGRKAFTFVDFTASALLPQWLPRDAVGGRRGDSGAFELDPSASTGSLQALTSALQAAVQEPRFLKSIAQWSAIYWRWAPTAVATGQIEMCTVIVYHSVIMRLAEQERLARSQGWIAIQYDTALRKSWARRTQQCDPELCIKTEAGRVVDEVLDVVRSQVQAASSSGSGGHPPAAHSGSAAESVLAKAGAAAQALTKRAEAASKEMSRAERALASREEALHSSSSSGRGKGGKEGKGGKDSKRDRGKSWWQIGNQKKQRWS